jgi:predicted SAM-dependent methyltransferase
MKLHLGCGKRYLEGFVHIDIADFDHIDYKSSIDNLFMIKDNSCDLIYASHVLEYFSLEEADTVLNEWNKKLKKNGILRVAVPNLESLILVYNKTKSPSNILGPLYGKWDVGKDVIYHKTIYDRDSLHSKFKKNGFYNINEWDWRKELPKNYDDQSIAYFPHMDIESGIHVSLNLQCYKV